jgi:hypothetical protein
MKITRLVFLGVLMLAGFGQAPFCSAETVSYVEPSRPYSSSPFLKTTRKKPVEEGGALLIPLITWAADGVTVDLNHGLEPTAGTPLAKALGKPVKLEVVDDFDRQVQNYISGKSAFLRGTSDMIALVSQALKGTDPGLEPVVIFQLSTSTGADGFVVRGVDKLSDLKGKTIVTQLNGPHLSLIGNMLRDAKLTARDLKIKFVPDITAAPDWKPGSPVTDPAKALRADSSVAGATCISPDITALTGEKNLRDGADGTLRGATALVTTKTASKIIFDV